MSEIPNLVTPEFEGAPVQTSRTTKKCRFLAAHSRFLLRRYQGKVVEPLDFRDRFNKYEIVDAGTDKVLLLVGQEGIPDREGLNFDMFDVRKKKSKVAFSTFYQLNPECCGMIRAPDGMTLGSNGVNIGEFMKGGNPNASYNAGLSLRIEFPEENQFYFKGPFCIVGGLCEKIFGNSYQIFNNSNKKIGKLQRVSKGKVGKIAPSTGYLMEIDSVEDGDSIAHLLGGMILLEMLFYNQQKKNRINCCTLACSGKLFDCCIDYSCLIREEETNTLMETTKVTATQNEPTL